MRVKIRDIERRLGREGKALVPGGVIIFALWLVTLFASNVSWLIVTSFWVVVGVGILLWVRHDLRKDFGAFRDMQRGYESALRRNEAEVFEVRATAFAEFEEVEDEGAYYAFQLDGGRLVFVAGQEFYPQAKFPSLDFSLVYFLDERGGAVDMSIKKRGSLALPARTIPPATKKKLELAEHLEVVDGEIERVEELLQPGLR